MRAEDLIYDVGMHRGDDTAFYLASKYRVVAIEADPTLAEAARTRFAREIGDGRLTLLNVGIAEEEGEADFWICGKTSEWNSFDRAFASRDNAPHHRIRIPTCRFTRILKQFGAPHYLKVDIEGNDRFCLEALASLTADDRPTYVSWESEMPDGVAPSTRLLDLMHQLGYSRYKLIEQSTFEPITPDWSLRTFIDAVANRGQRKFPLAAGRGLFRRFTYRGSLERRLSRRFPMGTSGPWGEEMPGRWMTYEQACATMAAIAERVTARLSHSEWCDWHARR